MRALTLKMAVLCAALLAGSVAVAVAASTPPKIPTGPQAGALVAAGSETLVLDAGQPTASWQRKTWRATERFCKKQKLSVLSVDVCGRSVSTSKKLANGKTYRITVSGGWNAWHGGTARCGSFQTVKGTLASADALFSFGSKRKRDCKRYNWSKPRLGSGFVFSRNDGLAYERPSLTPSAPATDGVYSWNVVGLGQPMYFAIADFGGVTDNQGGLTITVEKLGR